MPTLAASTQSVRSRIYHILEGRGAGGESYLLIQRFIIALIVLNVVAVIAESNRDLYEAYSEFFHAFELFSVIIFSAEYLCRVWVACDQQRFAHMGAGRARLSYMLTPMALIDLFAIAPFYLSLFIPIDLRYLRFFRLLRLLKLSHYFDGLKIFSEVLSREASAIGGALLTMMILIIISACLMFTVENAAQPGHFESITEAIWWAVVTLTTVGYGDITPITFAGKLLAIAIMLMGIGTMALPAGILAARFSEELQLRREYMAQQVAEALSDGLLDSSERDALATLQKKLGLSTEVFDRLVKTQQLRAQRTFCHHCGEKLV